MRVSVFHSGLALATFLFVARAACADGPKQEADRAYKTGARIEAEWPLLGAGPVTDFVRALGTRLGKAAGPAPFEWSFVVFRNHRANAFAIGGGRIYVSDGAIETCRTEAELAAMLAHEMGHELAGHFRRSGAEADPNEPQTPPGASHLRIGSVTQELDPAKEIEADRVSIRILQAAGYDPRATLDIAGRLSKEGTAGSAASDRERLAALGLLLRNLPAGGRTDTEEFQRLRRQVTQEKPP